MHDLQTIIAANGNHPAPAFSGKMTTAEIDGLLAEVTRSPEAQAHTVYRGALDAGFDVVEAREWSRLCRDAAAATGTDWTAFCLNAVAEESRAAA